MKVASKIIFLLKDPEGLIAPIVNALHFNPNSSLRRLDESFELSLEHYGIKEKKAGGELVHFLDDRGNYQVSVLLLQNYEPPSLVCAINEVLAHISAASGSKVSLYGLQIGPETNITQAMTARIKKPAASLQIHYEPLACFLQLVRVLKLPTLILIGQGSTSHSDKSSEGKLEILYEIGELLANNTGLCFLRDKILWKPTETSKDAREPWRALYG
ncbi:hypothetical protein Patl1_01793 [Pistacia atlantica]|uniref:Uncharacterized protein n=1 Tax=Pistacia atlantica TaxID=434234 RepID=A0ACC1C925_9ROSI|nr:hypothetical protein Patl1_01793 [Pistacia atlantica]